MNEQEQTAPTHDHWRVDVSFYIPMSQVYSTTQANHLVDRTLSRKSIKDRLGEADVHYEDTVAWNVEG